MSVLSYFTSELTRGYHLEREEEKYAQKRQRVYTFMKTPRELEKFGLYGFFQCLDAFLFVFTFLPLRIILAILKMFTVPCGFMRSRNFLEPAQKCDILKGVILVVCSFIMSYIDTSMMYHIVRGQATIKLYVFFNMLDMADRLLSNFGHDILDALFWTATEPRGRKREHLGTLTHLFLAIVYVIIHTLLILFQATVLNVAFNSHNKSLLVIMMSNNFVEIKSNLFKKVDINHLYQISCSDMKERFHYVILLSVVCVRNMNEVAWDIEHLAVLLPDALIVLISEVFVDWGKHAFILKFNEIPADVYREFKVKLALDMATSRQTEAFTDHSDLVSRRMGLTPLPLACLLYRILTKSVPLTCYMHYIILLAVYMCLMSFKVLNSIILLGHSYKVIENYHTEQSAKQENKNSYNKDNSKSTNQNCASNTDTPTKSSNLTRRSSLDSQVPRQFSQVFSADSYSEITQTPLNTSIEQTGGFTSIEQTGGFTSIEQTGGFTSIEQTGGITIKPFSAAASDNEEPDCSLDSEIPQKPSPVGENIETQSVDDSADLINISQCNNLSTNEKEAGLNLNQSHNSSSSTDDSLQEATVFQKSSRSVLMSFSNSNTLSTSASVPENIGQLECMESDNELFHCKPNI